MMPIDSDGKIIASIKKLLWYNIEAEFGMAGVAQFNGAALAETIVRMVREADAKQFMENSLS